MLVMRLADEEATRCHHECIGTEHLLLALLKQDSRASADILTNLGVAPEIVQQKMEKPNSAGPDGRAKKTIEYAMAEAQNLKHEDVGPEHRLLGLLREKDGVAADVLTDFGVTLEAARAEVLNNGQ